MKEGKGMGWTDHNERYKARSTRTKASPEVERS